MLTHLSIAVLDLPQGLFDGLQEAEGSGETEVYGSGYPRALLHGLYTGDLYVPAAVYPVVVPLDVGSE